MAFGSVSKKIKTNRISSSYIINENKKNRLVKITQDNFISIEEYKDLRKYLSENKNNNELLSLIN